MNRSTGAQLIAYSLLLASLGLLTHQSAPTLSKLALPASLAGAVFCLGWGLRALLGNRGKALPILTLLPVTYIMLSQAVMAWGDGLTQVPGRNQAVLTLAAMFALSVAMLIRIAYAGGTAPTPTNSPAQPARSTPTSSEARGHATTPQPSRPTSH